MGFHWFVCKTYGQTGKSTGPALERTTFTARASFGNSRVPQSRLIKVVKANPNHASVKAVKPSQTTLSALIHATKQHNRLRTSILHVLPAISIAFPGQTSRTSNLVIRSKNSNLFIC
jgi:hypothetical protein